MSPSPEEPVIYSHGPGAADGKVNGPGYPLDISGATADPVIAIDISAGSANVFLEHHPGPMLADGTFDEWRWADTSGGGWAVTPGQGLRKILPKSGEYWRTRVADIAGGGEVRSSVGRLDSEGNVARVLPRNPGVYFSTPYDR